MDAFGTRAGFVGSVLDGDEGLLVLRGPQAPDAAWRVGEHLHALYVAGARHVRVDAHGASGLEADLLPVLLHAQHLLSRKRGMLSVTGLGLASGPRAVAA
jgi:hypothetical protein